MTSPVYSPLRRATLAFVVLPALAFFSAFLAAAPALAADAPAAASASASGPSPAVKAEARERFDTGLHLFEKGENAGALAEFKRAYTLIPNPVVLYNMGLVYAAMNRPVDSLDALTQFLADPGSAGPVEQKHATEVRAEQEKRIAQLVVLTEHPATVQVDGVEVGHTPLGKPIRVASGSHVVAVEAPGFLGSRREVTLAGQLTETIAMSMQPTDTRMAQLVVTCAVPGAEVVVNGKRVGATPLSASVAVPPGKANVELQRAGYVTAKQTIALDEGARGELAFSLDEDPAAPPAVRGRLVVRASEPGAEITVDGGPRRPLAGPMTLPVGPHHVSLVKAGFEISERSVEVLNGQDASLLVTLVPTTENAAHLEDERHTMRTVGWSLAIGGLALLAGGTVYGLVSNGNVSSAQKDLDAVLAEQMQEVLPGGGSNPCWNHPITPGNAGQYAAAGCQAFVDDPQNKVNTAKLERILGFSAAGVGAVAAGIGVYLIATHGKTESGVGVATASVWSDGCDGAGLTLGGRF
jgi:hypothetical protein